jgi:hypothetical protein
MLGFLQLKNVCGPVVGKVYMFQNYEVHRDPG